MTTAFSESPTPQEPAPAPTGQGRTLGWVSLATVAKVVYGLVAMALAARNLGLESIGDLGQMLTILAIVTQLSTFGLGRGVTARHAAYAGDWERLAITNAAIAVITAAGFIMAGAVISGAYVTSLYESFFSSEDLLFTAWLLIAQVPLTAAGAILLAIAAAHGDADRASQAAIASFATGILILFVVRDASLAIFVTAVVLQSGLTMVLIAGRLGRRLVDEYGLAPRRVYTVAVHRLAQVHAEARFIAAFAFAIAIPVLGNLVVRLVSRVMIRNELGGLGLGRWEAVTRVQDGYLQFLGAALALVLLPTLIKSPRDALALQVRYIAGFALLCAVGAGIAAVVGGETLELAFGNAAGGTGDLLALAFLMDLARSPFLVLQYGNLAKGSVARFLRLELLASAGLLAAVFAGLQLGAASLESVFAASVVVCAVISLVAIRTTIRNRTA
jgi:O-antigen/teichoic acid export membrane protein